MEIITSTSNSLIKDIAKLKTTKGRKEAQQFTVEGIRAVTTFIEEGFTPFYLFAIEEHENTLAKLNHNESYLVAPFVMEKISNAKSPSGLLAVFEMPANPNPKKLTSGLVLANICDPGNMGTLIRSAASFGYESVIIVEGCDPFSPKVLQATAGTLPFVNLFRWSWQELLNHKKELNLAALVVKDGVHPNTLQKKNTLFVVGNEAHGIADEYLKTCEQLVTLPMPGNTESLNASIAGSIALYLLLD